MKANGAPDTLHVTGTTEEGRHALSVPSLTRKHMRTDTSPSLHFASRSTGGSIPMDSSPLGIPPLMPPPPNPPSDSKPPLLTRRLSAGLISNVTRNFTRSASSLASLPRRSVSSQVGGPSRMLYACSIDIGRHRVKLFCKIVVPVRGGYAACGADGA